MESEENIATTRKAYASVLGGCVALGIGGVMYSVIGEWYTRRRLPPEMQSPEAIQFHYDGTACFDCGLWGFLMVAGAIVMGVSLGILWLLIELAESRKASKFR